MSVDDDTLRRSRIAPELADAMKASEAGGAGDKWLDDAVEEPKRRRVIIEMNAKFPGGEQAARLLLLRGLGLEEALADLQRLGWIAVTAISGEARINQELPTISRDDVRLVNALQTDRFLFADLTDGEIAALADATADVPILDPRSGEPKTWTGPLVYKIWLDNSLQTLVYVSSRTIKGDAAQAAFKSAGRDIVWAVADTGVARHRHFDRHKNLELPEGLQHRDFTGGDQQPPFAAQEAALVDTAGHGTHVAGIIAGEAEVGEKDDPLTIADGDTDVRHIAGVAPHCKILSLKVLTDDRKGDTAALIAAIGYIQTLNGYGRNIRVHGLNISLGYDFDPKNFAAGQSPLCAEVDRLVKCGVAVVVAAGNGGGGFLSASGGASTRAAFLSTIMDPGNAELAVTVGSTHRDRPVTYGVSYFSAKGPTIDGRMKPDLVAPGERIVSCEASGAGYRMLSGTSMAAPHVSGAIAAFLSVRGEFRGQPERVKRLLTENATDLGRRPEFQGAGLIDLMRTLQAI